MSNKHIRKLKYEFRAGARYGVDATVVGKELDRIHKTHGVVQPGVVVEESRPDDAPLHPVFDWDDEAAAEKYRIWQARNIIRSVRVVEDESSDHAVQRWVNVPSISQSDSGKSISAGYQPTTVVVSRPDMYASALCALQQKLNSAKAALEELQSAAISAPDVDHERMSRIAIAVQAMQTASAAVQALH